MKILDDVSILGIGTAVPSNALRQDEFGLRMSARGLDRSKARYLDSILKECGIAKRHTIIDLTTEGRANHNGSNFEEATTSVRNDLFNKEIRPLACKSVRDAYETSNIESDEITHLITVTCTGFANPGFDVALIEQGLVPASVHRYSLGFMGCYGAFPALELAYMIALADPTAHILCICAELCSLHFQPHLGTFDDLLSSVLFADGVAAVVVGRKGGPSPYYVLPRIRSFGSKLLPEGEDDMSWSIGDTGFKIVLSPYVSRIIGSAIEELIPESWHPPQDGGPDHWIVHPGGRSILDRVQEGLGLAEHKLEDSRAILRDFGNMSSATVLFVLDRLVRSARLQPNQKIGMLGFGPGLTVKSLLLET